SHLLQRHLVEQSDSRGWDPGVVHNCMCLEPGNLWYLIQQYPGIGTSDKLPFRLQQVMLEALNYHASRGWIHRDVKL
ncbi:hypothetical protein G647_10215, partial [Cladophialophora carrionii CBS 160.54]